MHPFKVSSVVTILVMNNFCLYTVQFNMLFPCSSHQLVTYNWIIQLIRRNPKVQLIQLGCWKKHTQVRKLKVPLLHASLHLLIRLTSPLCSFVWNITTASTPYLDIYYRSNEFNFLSYCFLFSCYF